MTIDDERGLWKADKCHICGKSYVVKQIRDHDHITRGVATNSGLGRPGSNRDLFCVVSSNVV